MALALAWRPCVAVAVVSGHRAQPISLWRGQALLRRTIANGTLQVEARSKHLAGQCRDLCHYVEKYSGGQSKTCLLELDAWSKTLQTRREVQSKQLYILSTAGMAHQPEWITACCKALLAAPKTFLRKEEACIFDARDIENMTGKCKDKVEKAVDVMRSCRKWAAECGLTPEAHPKLSLAIGCLDVNLVHHVHDKKCKERSVHDSVEDIGGVFVKMVQANHELKGDAPKPPYAVPQETAGAASSAAPMREYTQGGTLAADTVTRAGFQVKGLVTREDDDEETVFTIAAVNDGGVKLSFKEGGKDKVRIVPCSEFLNKYKLKKDTEPVYLSTGLPSADKSSDAVSKYVEAVVRTKLHEAFVEQRQKYDNYATQVKPDKRVFAAQAAQKGAIVMVPFTTSISVVKTKPLDSAVSVPGVVHTDESGRKYYCIFQKREVLPTAASSEKKDEPFVVPYWNVRKVTSESDATVKASTIQAGDFSLPCYVLKKDAVAGTELTIFVRSATSAPSAPAASVLVKGKAMAGPKRAAAAPAANAPAKRPKSRHGK